MKISALKNLIQTLNQSDIPNKSTIKTGSILNQSSDLDISKSTLKQLSKQLQALPDNKLQNLPQSTTTLSKLNQELMKEVVQSLFDKLQNDRATLFRFLLDDLTPEGTGQQKTGELLLKLIEGQSGQTAPGQTPSGGENTPAVLQQSSGKTVDTIRQILQQIQRSSGNLPSVSESVQGTTTISEIPDSLQNLLNHIQQLQQERTDLTAEQTQKIRSTLKQILGERVQPQAATPASSSTEGTTPNVQTTVNQIIQQNPIEVLDWFHDTLQSQKKLQFLNEMIDFVSQSLDQNQLQNLRSTSMASSRSIASMTPEEVFKRIQTIIQQVQNEEITRKQGKQIIQKLLNNLSNQDTQQLVQKLTDFQQKIIDDQPALQQITQAVQGSVDTQQSMQHLRMFEAMQLSSDKQVLLVKIPEGEGLQKPGFLQVIQRQKDEQSRDDQTNESESNTIHQVGIHLSLSNIGTVIGKVRLEDQEIDVELYSEKAKVRSLFQGFKSELESALRNILPQHTSRIHIRAIRNGRTESASHIPVVSGDREPSNVDKQA